MAILRSGILSVALLAVGLAGCEERTVTTTATPGTTTQPHAAAGFGDLYKAVAVMHAAGDQQITGTVTFMEEQAGVRIAADIRGLEPNSVHAFHIHEFGDCTAGDFSSAGGHYNPWDATHGGPDTSKEKHHAGDLGNIEANAEGVALKELVMQHITIAGQNPILGRAVILHAGQDDLKSDPAGNAGGRIACGVIGIAQAGQ
ncbi:MAG: hypothetical protein AMXMBFR13_11860 [Phycisphaerae bacterium]